VTQELVYTSAPQGLKPGTRGFCAVVATRGMAGPLATVLESLSAYRPAFPSDDPRSELNPVCLAHVRASVAGKTYNILSRVADYGLDYSQRTNKLAHHVVLDSNERPEAGPGWLLAQPEFMDSRWDGQPRLLPTGRRVPSGNERPTVCRAWAQQTSDAGWAGVLAEAWLADVPSYVIFAPGTKLLPLLREAVALLPREKRWTATFSTYFTNLPGGVTCACRCVLDGSPEAIQARRLPKALRIDLTQPLAAAHHSPLVEAARTGNLGNTPPIPVSRPVDVFADQTSSASAPPIPAVPRHSTDPQPIVKVSPGTYGLQKQEAAPPPTPTERQRLDGHIADARRRIPRWPIPVVALAGVLAIGSLFAVSRLRTQTTATTQIDPSAGGAVIPPIPAAPDKKGKGSQKPDGQTAPAITDARRKTSSPPKTVVKADERLNESKVATARAKEANAKAQQAPATDPKSGGGTAKRTIALASMREMHPPFVVLRIPDQLHPGEEKALAGDLKLTPDSRYSVSLWMPEGSDLTTIDVPSNPSAVALEGRVDLKKSEILRLSLVTEKPEVRILLDKNDSDRAAERTWEIVRFSRLVLTPVHAEARKGRTKPGDVECRFFSPETHGAQPEGARLPDKLPAPLGKKQLKGGKAPKSQACKWRIQLPLSVTSRSPKMYVDNLCLGVDNGPYRFIPESKGEATLDVNQHRTARLICDRLRNELISLASDGLHRERVERALKNTTALLTVSLEPSQQDDERCNALVIDSSQLMKVRNIIEDEHFNRLKDALRDVFGVDELKKQKDKLQKRISVFDRVASFNHDINDELTRRIIAENAKRNQNQIDRDRIVQSNHQQDDWLTLLTQAERAKKLFHQLESANIVSGRVYFRVFKGRDSDPERKAVEIDVVCIEASKARG